MWPFAGMSATSEEGTSHHASRQPMHAGGSKEATIEIIPFWKEPRRAESTVSHKKAGYEVSGTPMPPLTSLNFPGRKGRKVQISRHASYPFDMCRQTAVDAAPVVSPRTPWN